ncbi:hypothetical protein [Acinetobacter nectaris]|uniref:hypothetical protein n=1 Tax=Acinetobacter nectaris TaxID=1219382 RepID=UPI001F3F8FB2|nr:hypothetical protein [Acinetobacter nectaris]MCF9034695.1 hypothetical protein [Acinetobacter nectaris]
MIIQKELKIDDLVFEGQGNEVAVQVFEKIASPMAEEIFRQSPDVAHTFASHMLWLSMGMYADLFKNPETAEKGITHLSEIFLKALREHPNELMS